MTSDLTTPNNPTPPAPISAADNPKQPIRLSGGLVTLGDIDTYFLERAKRDRSSFVPGHRVTLKTGGPEMTLLGHTPHAENSVADSMRCAWFDAGDQYHSADIPSVALRDLDVCEVF